MLCSLLFAPSCPAPLCSVLICVQAAGVLLDEMHYVLDDAERQGLRPDAYTLNTFVLAYAALLDTESVTRLVQEWFPRYGYQPDVRTYRAIIRMVINCCWCCEGVWASNRNFSPCFAV